MSTMDEHLDINSVSLCTAGFSLLPLSHIDTAPIAGGMSSLLAAGTCSRGSGTVQELPPATQAAAPGAAIPTAAAWLLTPGG